MKSNRIWAAGRALGFLAALLTACAPATPAEPVVLPAETPAVTEAEENPANAQPVQLPTVTPSPARDPQVQQILDSLGNQGPAPELTNDVWINSEPRKLADLRGKVVMIEFWTYG